MTLSVEDEDLGKDEKSIQEAFDKQFNRQDYNIWHTFDRHSDYNVDVSGDHFLSTFSNPEEELDAEERYASVCRLIRESLKPEWAELVIAVNIDGENIRDYADRIGESENNLSQKRKRAEKKLKEILEKRQI